MTDFQNQVLDEMPDKCRADISSGAKLMISQVFGSVQVPDKNKITRIRKHNGTSYSVVATLPDIPGIIEGAHEGKGLGLRFLRHIERNSVLLFMIPIDTKDIRKEYKILLNELKHHNPELLHKQRVIAITKADMLDDELIAAMKKEIPKDKMNDGTKVPVLFISSVTNKGITELKDVLWKLMNETSFLAR